MIHSREVVLLIPIVRKLVDNWMIIIDMTLHIAVLINEIVHVLKKPGVNDFLTLAPVPVLRRVPTVSNRDYWEGIVRHHPRVNDRSFFPVFEAQGLIVPS